jgi:hypothetical protein
MSCSSCRYNTSHTSAYRTLQEQQLYPYHILSVQVLVPHDAPARRAFCQWILQQSAEGTTFTEKVSFTDESCFTRTGITQHSQRTFVVKWKPSCSSITSLAAIVFHQPVGWNYRRLPLSPGISPARIGGRDYLIFFEHTKMDYWKMCPSLCAFACGFNTSVRHQSTLLKCVNGCLKTTPDAGLVVEVKLQSRGQHAHLTWILSIVSVEIFENRCLCHYSRCCKQSMESNSTICRWGKEYTRNLGTFESFSSTQSWLVSMNMKAISNTSCKRVIKKSY